MYETQAFALRSPTSDFERITIKRGDTGDDDVEIDIKYCGVCHSDIHLALNELGPYRNTRYPCVPGHEVAGIVCKVGKNVTRFRVGDHAGTGPCVDTCLTCKMCQRGEEPYCENGSTIAFDYDTKHGHIATESGYTFGGYSAKLTVNERFAVKIPDSYPLEYAGPVFCSGITTYSPLKYHGASKGGLRVGIIGVGGLGQMGIRLAASMGNEVTAISTSRNKEQAAKAIGATHFVVSTDPESMERAAKSLDLVLNTVSADHQVATYLPLLDYAGTIVMLGASKEHKISPVPLMYGRLSITGSAAGNLGDTQELIDYCAEKNIKPTIQLIGADKLMDVFKELKGGKSDAVVRYVLDIQKSLYM